MDTIFQDAKIKLLDNIPGHFPTAKPDTSDGWRLGDVTGEKGTSLHLNSQGAFYDHATGDSGDILDLYQRMHGLPSPLAAAQSILGTDRPRRGPGRPRKTPQAPQKPAAVSWPHDLTPAEAGTACNDRPADMVTIYRDMDRLPLFAVCRWNGTGAEKKKIRPIYYTARGWTQGLPPGLETRPLLDQAELVESSGPVLIAEGEKCCLAARSIGINATTWTGGAVAARLVDVSPLAGRDVILWPDHDEPGHKAMETLAARLRANGCRVRTVAVPADKPEGWDLADCIETEGAGDALALIEAATETGPNQTETGTGDFFKPTACPYGTPCTILRDKKDNPPERRNAILEMIGIEAENGQPAGRKKHNGLREAEALAQADPDFSRLVMYDEATGRRVWSPAYKNIEAVKTAIMRKGLEYGLEWGPQIRQDIVETIADNTENEYNSVLDLFEDLTKEHPEADLETALDEFTALLVPADSGAVENIRKIWKHFFIRSALLRLSVFRKIGEPIQLDIVPILTGPQGIGKSTLARYLGMAHRSKYVDLGAEASRELTADTNVIRKIGGMIVAELGELAGVRKGDVDSLKAFLTRTDDGYRKLYHEDTTTQPRTVAFIGTGNTNQFLRDTTGNRRFYPIRLQSIDLLTLHTKGQDLVERLYSASWTEAKRILEAGPGAVFAESIAADKALMAWVSEEREGAADRPAYYPAMVEHVRQIEKIELAETRTGVGRRKTQIKIAPHKIGELIWPEHYLTHREPGFKSALAGFLEARGYVWKKARAENNGPLEFMYCLDIEKAEALAMQDSQDRTKAEE